MSRQRTPEEIQADLALVGDADVVAFDARRQWLLTARPKQLLPPGDWDTCVWIAGRFFGKTRCIVEPSWWEAWRVPGIRVHALSPTLGDIRRTIFEGESGFLAKIPTECLLGASRDKAYNKTDKELTLSNGSKILGFACVEEADRLRGPQCHHLLFDEAAAADRPSGNLEAAWKVAALGCRLPYPDGSPSRKLIATTPRPIPFLKRLIKRPGVVTINGTSYENLANVAVAVRRELLALEGTLYGKQEIHGLFIDEESDLSILKRSWIRLWPVDRDTGRPRNLPEFSFIIESYDTASSEENFDAKKQETDPTASIVLGIFNVAQCFNEQERKALGVRSKYAALLLDAWTERLGLPDLLDRARKQHRTLWGPRGKGRRADVVLIEDKSSGPGVRQMLAKWGVPCWPFNPRVSKAMRGHGISPLIKQGMLFVPESGREDRKGLSIDWAEPFLEVVTAFAGEGSVLHDDYFDCLTSAFTYLKDRGLLEATPDEQYLDLEEKKSAEQAEAVRIREAERAKEARNPYGV